MLAPVEVRDDDNLVRAAAAGAIANRGDPTLLTAVVPLLDDQNASVRFNSAAAIIRLNGVAKAKERKERKPGSQ